MTAPDTMYAVITHDAVDKEVPKSFAILERAGDMAVLRYRNITIVPVNTRRDFQALKDTCSDCGCTEVDNYFIIPVPVFIILTIVIIRRSSKILTYVTIKENIYELKNVLKII